MPDNTPSPAAAEWNRCRSESESDDDGDDTIKVTLTGYGNVNHPWVLKVNQHTQKVDFQIQGHPSPAKVIRIPDALAGRLKHLALHRHDLNRARKFLGELDQQGRADAVNAIGTVRQALWYGAISSTMNCFQVSESREKLHADTIFGTDQSTATRQAFDYMKSTRNKHALRDESNWHQAIPLAVVATRGYQPQVTDVQCQVMEDVRSHSDITRLRTLINTTLGWVKAEFEAELTTIINVLEARPFDDLIALEELIGTTPYESSGGRKRAR